MVKDWPIELFTWLLMHSPDLKVCCIFNATLMVLNSIVCLGVDREPRMENGGLERNMKV